MKYGKIWKIKSIVNLMARLYKPHIYYNAEYRKWDFIKSCSFTHNLEAGKFVSKLNRKGN